MSCLATTLSLALVAAGAAAPLLPRPPAGLPGSLRPFPLDCPVAEPLPHQLFRRWMQPWVPGLPA